MKLTSVGTKSTFLKHTKEIQEVGIQSETGCEVFALDEVSLWPCIQIRSGFYTSVDSYEARMQRKSELPLISSLFVHIPLLILHHQPSRTQEAESVIFI